jgi:hypothetical protein
VAASSRATDCIPDLSAIRPGRRREPGKAAYHVPRARDACRAKKYEGQRRGRECQEDAERMQRRCEVAVGLKIALRREYATRD